MNTPENESIPAEDTLKQLQKLVDNAESAAANEIEAWQKLHVVLHDTKSLLRSFAIDQQAVGTEKLKFRFQSQFSHLAATTFVPTALQLQDLGDPRTSKAAANVLLSSIQLSLSSNLADFPDPNSFQATRAFLESSSYPIQGAIERLRPLISAFSEVTNTRLKSVAADLQHATNPLNLTNAATNARELFTFLAREFQSEEALSRWPDVVFDNGKPTRRTRLECYMFLGLPKSALPEKWVETVGIQVSPLMDCFGELSKLTHLNAETTSALATARLKIGEFIEHLVLCLQAREETKSLLVDALQEPVSDRLQELAEGELHQQLESGFSHAYGPSVWVDQLDLDEIDGMRVSFSGSGSITCTFQIGSDGDVRRDEGAEWEGSRGLSFEGIALLSSTNRLNAFEDVTIEPEDCELDDHDDLTEDDEDDEDEDEELENHNR